MRETMGCGCVVSMSIDHDGDGHYAAVELRAALAGRKPENI